MENESLEQLEHRVEQEENEGRFADAIKTYERMIVASEGNISKAIGYMQCGKCYAELGNLSEAIVYLNNAVKLDSEFVNAFCERGRMYRMQGSIESALEDFDRAIELAPSFADAHNRRGECLMA